MKGIHRTSKLKLKHPKTAKNEEKDKKFNF